MPATTDDNDDEIPYSCTERDILGTSDGYNSGRRHANRRIPDIAAAHAAMSREDLVQEVYFRAFEVLYDLREKEIGSGPGQRGRRSVSLRTATFFAGFMAGYLAVIDGIE